MTKGERRKVPRQSDEGQHRDLDEEQSHSVFIGRDLNSGPCGAVEAVADPISNALYAGQLQPTSNEDHENEAAWRHLEIETKAAEKYAAYTFGPVDQLLPKKTRKRPSSETGRPHRPKEAGRSVPRERVRYDQGLQNREWIRPGFENAFRC